MIDKRPHRNLRRELRRAADMVIVIVRDQHKINLLDAGILRGRGDAIRVTPAIPRPSRVDQQRLPFRRNKQRRLPALNVDKINLQRFLRHGSRRSPGKYS